MDQKLIEGELIVKVLQINTVLNSGSTGRICRDIADTLSYYGHESVIAYGRGESNENYDTIKIGNRLDNYLHYSKSVLFNQHGFGSKYQTSKFIKKIKQYNPDIIHLHNIHGYYLHIEELFEYLKKAEKPIIWLLHDQWVISGGAAYFDINSFYNSNTEKKHFTSKNEYPKALTRINETKNITKKKRIFSDLYNAKIITPSKWLKSEVSSTWLKEYDIETIYNGVDTKKFRPHNSTLREDFKIGTKKVLLGVASFWDYRKGIDFIKELPRELGDDYQIVLIGVDKKLKSELPKSIISITRTENTEELMAWYSTADILINPTLFDNFPTVNIESLACGTPVITYDTGGSGEAIDLDTGVIVPHNNQEAFISAIIKWPKKNEKIIKACITRSKMFEKELQYKKYIELYENLLTNKNNKIVNKS